MVFIIDLYMIFKIIDNLFNNAVTPVFFFLLKVAIRRIEIEFTHLFIIDGMEQSAILVFEAAVDCEETIA